MGTNTHQPGKNLITLFILSFAIISTLSLLADWIIPSYRATSAGVVLHGSYSLAFALLIVAVLFALLLGLMAIITLSQRRAGSLTKILFLRRIAVGVVLVCLTGLLVFSSISLLTKRLLITPNLIQLTTLCSNKSLSWDEIQSVQGNFVSGTKISLAKEQTAWLQIQRVGGEAEIWDLRFLRGVNRLRSILNDYTKVLP